MFLGSDAFQMLARAVSRRLGRQSAFVNRLRPAYEAALQWIHGDAGIPWSINGVPFRIDPKHRQLMGQTWDPEVAAFLRDRVRAGAVCVDVGANAGVYVLQFCHWSKPNGRVIAFEPNPITREILQRHVRMNGFQDRVEIVPMAISDRAGQAEFHYAGASGMSRLGQANAMLEGVDQVTVVETTTLDAFCSEHGLNPDWLLIDIEGYEFQALRGAQDVISRQSVGVVVEMHPTLWPSAHTSLGDWTTFFAEQRRRPLSLMGQKDPLAEIGSVLLTPA